MLYETGDVIGSVPMSDAPQQAYYGIFPPSLFFAAVALLLLGGFTMNSELVVRLPVPVAPRTAQMTGPDSRPAEHDGNGRSTVVTFKKESVHLFMEVLISVVLLAATLFVLLSKKYDAKDKHWAYGTVGLIIGFWLKP
jgi:hypothetical protein